ncbi:MAG TPA: carbamoyl-phosphate synthase large subunit [Candidatus Acidoferrales bacterium]|nr:carbamoyl-phosphate synthase large subunit [Candidatus Acidoferrales bacterium]
MPKRTDIKSILLIGSGPIVIGQACEFDYSGTQALKSLKEEGYRVILVNSNPATIMTDPDFADRTYIEPITADIVEKVIARERPDALLPTLGGQTALNIALDLADQGVLERYGVEMIGAKADAIKKAEDRDLFKEAMQRAGLDLPRSGYARSLREALAVQKKLKFPVIIRPSRTLGGSGGNIAYGPEDFKEVVQAGLNISPVHEVLVEESVLGWKEFELEVMRDRHDNVVIVCPIENFDPMGVHTGDSITVAPAQTLTDKEYQIMRDAAVRVMREIGVDTGGSNIQFAINPADGRLVVIEMNPRVSRSSALASKATGFPIAKIAAKLAVGYTLDEIRNDITRETPACFEPTIDYVVVKIPRFTFEKFPKAKDVLTPQMKSVGEAMAIGRTFKEALHKAMRSLEIGSFGFESKIEDAGAGAIAKVREKLRVPNAERLWYLGDAFRLGMPVEEVYELSRIDRWFLRQIEHLIRAEEELKERAGESLETESLLRLKQMGFSDHRLARLLDRTEADLRALRIQRGVRAVFRAVDTCGAEFAAYTPYLYSTYEGEDESNASTRKKILILGGGPNRIGQGIEFDYCCVHAAFALREAGYETIMVNCNPETVSTDYDTSDKLYFEPLTLEDVLNITDRERPDGVIVQFGGQTPLKLALALERAGVKIVGTSPKSIDLAEDREKFKELLDRLGLKQPPSGIARSYGQALEIAARLGYPVLVRPSYVLGGRAMEIVYDSGALEHYITHAVAAAPEHPVLIDKFLDDAIEIDVDAVADGERVVIGGIMEHIERAGVHSGDSACALPPKSLSAAIQDEIRAATVALAQALEVRGLVNVQFAVQERAVYVLEVNPRASRTVPFVSKAIGVPLAKLAAQVMVGKKLSDLGLAAEIVPRHVSVKEAVFPFNKFPGVDTLLGPEMKSTGEVMGLDASFGMAYAKAQLAGGMRLPLAGKVFISVRDEDKERTAPIARRLRNLGFDVVATRGTAAYLQARGVRAETVNKVQEGSPHVADAIQAGEIAMVINTPTDSYSQADSYYIRRAALDYQVPYFTTIAGADAAVEGIELLKSSDFTVRALQEYHKTHAKL